MFQDENDYLKLGYIKSSFEYIEFHLLIQKQGAHS